MKSSVINSKIIINKIREYARAQNKAKSNLAVEAGLDAKTLQNFWDENWNPTLTTLQKLEAILPQTEALSIIVNSSTNGSHK